jgi:hypothetical protein
VIKLSARHAQRPGVVHDQQRPGRAARAARPVLERRDDDKLGCRTGHDRKTTPRRAARQPQIGNRDCSQSHERSLNTRGLSGGSRVSDQSGVMDIICLMIQSSDPTARPALWGEVTQHPAAAPERLLLDAIAAGDLDEHLVAVADAVHARRALLHTVRAATAIANLCVGDTVRINRNVRPGYLHGEHGEIIELDDHAVTVRLLRPIGRFRSGELRCPPLALDKLEQPTRQPAA